MVFASFRCHGYLMWQLTKREIVGRYRGSMIGVLWAFLHPLALLMVYTVVFKGVFGARWAGSSDSASEFGLFLFAGLIVHSFVSESVHRAPYLIVNNSNYVKKVIFPLEVLAWTSLGASLFHAGMSTITLILLAFVLQHSVSWTVFLFPLTMFPLALGTVGISWILASTGVFFRDIGHAMGPIMTIVLFLSPVFYPESAMPEALRPLLHANPLTFFINQTRDLLIWGKLPTGFEIMTYCVAGYGLAWLGLFWFQKSRKAFADAL